MPDDAEFTPRGHHLIDGEWCGSEQHFRANLGHDVSEGTAAEVDRACRAAEAAFETYGWSDREDRARFLEAIADEIEAHGAEITRLGTAETGLPAARLDGERGRTTGQLRLFAAHIRAGEYLDRRHDPALPDRQPLPRPDLKLVQRPIGPVAVFGASNFPLAFSTAGGDTASALAAGCPVVVKGHPAHPATGEIVAEAIRAAIEATGMPKGVFNFVLGSTPDVGRALVTHPLIRAVGFTGSLGAGRALFDACAARPEPIPFFGELGSINPVFLLPQAVAARGAEIGRAWAASLVMGAGQFCTNPGLAIVDAGSEGDALVEAARGALAESAGQTMLSDRIAAGYHDGRDRIGAAEGVRELLRATCGPREGAPALFETDARTWIGNEALGAEVFGPMGLVVRTSGAKEMLALARALDGQLTATLQMDEGDGALATRLAPILERKAGRILVNGFPTGVEVADAMVHGGPYPASTNFGATSVGTLAIRRFLRPVCYQNAPDSILPRDLR